MMDTEKLRQIRADVLKDIKEFLPQNCHKPIYHATKFHLFDKKLLEILKMAQTTKSGDITSRQVAAISLFERIFIFMKAKDEESKYADIDPEKESIKDYINNKLHLLKKVLKNYADCLSMDEEKKFLKLCGGLSIVESMKPEMEEVPGKAPGNAVGKLAVKAAWEFECSNHKKALAKDVMSTLQDWADNNEYSDTLLKSNKPKKSVVWITGKMVSKEYSIEACGKTLMKWQKSRS